MLVLTRRVGQKIVIPQHDIEITLLKIQGGKARIGVQATPTTKVFRKELIEQPQESQEAPAAA